MYLFGPNERYIFCTSGANAFLFEAFTKHQMESPVRHLLLKKSSYCLRRSRQGGNTLNRSMQGLWSTHRRNKVNLNNSASNITTPTTEEPPAISTATTPMEPETSAIAEIPVSLADSKPASANGKRKLRSSRATDESSLKRQKTASGSGSSKDHSPPSTRLADLGGVDACIEKMLEYIAMPLCHPEIYLHTGIQPPRGVLLHGPPGCGKTMLANAMAGVCLLHFLIVSLLTRMRRNLAYLS